jgi:outer membrane lipoprotein-sorting protein
MITTLRSIGVRTLRGAAVFAVLGVLAGGALVSPILMSPATAEKAKPAELDAAAKADIVRIEAYLNGIKTLRTRFLQIAQNGDAAAGELTIARPGRMRLEYDPPQPTLLIANGTFLIYIDRYLEQVTHVFLKNTPVGVLVAENIKLSGDQTVTRFVREPGVIRVTLAKTTEAEEGNITLVFADAPLALRQWVVVDAQGTRTSVTLDALEYGVAVKPEMFEYKKPERIQQN